MGDIAMKLWCLGCVYERGDVVVDGYGMRWQALIRTGCQPSGGAH
jgi:hypothetical protein